MRFVKIFVLLTSVLNKILAPNVFDYGDSESWHRAKYLWTTNPPFSLGKLVFVLIGALN